MLDPQLEWMFEPWVTMFYRGLGKVQERPFPKSTRRAAGLLFMASEGHEPIAGTCISFGSSTPKLLQRYNISGMRREPCRVLVHKHRV
jgi:hypothetical protein